jgi:hypothetical protein
MFRHGCCDEKITEDYVDGIFEKFKERLQNHDIYELCRHSKRDGEVEYRNIFDNLLKDSIYGKNRFNLRTPLKGEQLATMLEPIVLDFQKQTEKIITWYKITMFELISVSHLNILNVTDMLKHIFSSEYYNGEYYTSKWQSHINSKYIDEEIACIIDRYNETIAKMAKTDKKINLNPAQTYRGAFSICGWRIDSKLYDYSKTVQFGKYLCRLLKYAKRCPEHTFSFVFGDTI